MRPTPEQMEKAVAALGPYVHRWHLPLNPEDLYELAGAVLKHFDGDADFEEIEAAEHERINFYASQNAGLYRERTPEAFELWRTDIHGNEFFMRRFDDRAAADRERQEYEDRGHHQTYWVRRIDNTKPAPPQPE